MSVSLQPSSEETRLLARVARGEEPADLVLAGGSLIDVFTVETIAGWGVAVAAGRIAYVGPEADRRVGKRTELIDTSSRFVAPGLIDAHTHLIRAWLPEMVAWHLAAGVTTLVIDGTDVVAVLGEPGLRELLDDAVGLPGRVFVTVPPEAGLDPLQCDRLGPLERWVSLLDDPGIVGLGEVNWSNLLRQDPRAESLVTAALARGLGVEGHGAGARSPSLNALAAYGISGDHESISADDVINRARLGYYTLMRAGVTRSDLDAYATLWEEKAAPIDFGRLGFATDGIGPDSLASGRALNAVVHGAVERGLPLAQAIRMASLVGAERHGLGRWLGGVGPGMLADLIVIDGADGLLAPDVVLVGGVRPEVAVTERTGKSTNRRLDFSALDPDLLGHPGPGLWRAIEIISPLVTKEMRSDGSDALVVTVIDKLDARRAFRGLLVNFGLQRGAIAWNTGWESSAIGVVGATASEAALAVGRVASNDGGVVVVDGTAIAAEWRAEIGGQFTRAPLRQIATEIEAVNTALRSLGCPWPDGMTTLEALTSGAIPFLRISPVGYTRVKDGGSVGLAW